MSRDGERESTAGVVVDAREREPAESADTAEAEAAEAEAAEAGIAEAEAAEAGSGDSGGEGRTGSAAARRRLRAAGVAVLVALLLAGTGLLVQAARLNGDDALVNRALTDSSGTAAVAGDVSNALSKVFSYAPEDPGVTARDADDLLAGPAREQYRQLFGQIRQRVVAQELTLTTHVVRAGVIRLDGDDATLLVLLDQITERKGKDPATAGAQLSVTAERQDGQWRITDLKSR
ncbi:nuclear transport factor 2 family protein [Streptomyces sp. B22F1]|uniref:nuclear transport factor 2 family protein n=1 Tax=Streptomyces sp. B22F1 TaxID=3153566 RepID=UPI00325EE58E